MPFPPYTQTFEFTFQNDSDRIYVPMFYNRLEYSHYGALVPYTLFLILSFILCCIFHKRQPLKSKGVIPFVAL